MTENIKSPSNCCRYCGWLIQQDIVQKIVENNEPVICEFCGIEITPDVIKTREISDKVPHQEKSNLKEQVEQNNESITKRIGKLEKSRMYSVNMILEDKDFPLIFKENLIIVISRLLYTLIREWEQTNNVNIHRAGLNQSILTYLAKELKPILGKRISRKYLENLCNISTGDFDNLFRQFQEKLKLDQDYRAHFKAFLFWLMRIIFRLISDMWEMKNLPKFQATILKDLKSYPFNWNVKLSESDIPIEEKIESLGYNVKDFIDELTDELNNYPEEMYKLNPNRVLKGHSGYTLKDLSKLWGHHDGYVSERLTDHKNQPNYILPKKNLKELETAIRNKFGKKANHSYQLINSHKNSLLSLNLFIKKLRKEIGKISIKVKTTLEDIALIFGYGYGMMNYIRHNPNFVLTKRRLSIIRGNLKLILSKKARDVLKIVDKYQKHNPSMLDYANQKYTITQPNFFSNIFEDPQIMYWFGWLCSDGWVSRHGNKHYQIQLKLKRKDRIIIERFATVIGYNQDRIYDESYLIEDEDGELRVINSSRVIFGCKPMWLDLDKLGIFEFKIHGHVPWIIKDLIKRARRKNKEGKLTETMEGRLALCFLMGFYDGDGNYRGGMSARILNTKKSFLEEIASLFGISNDVNENNKKIIDEKTHKIIWKTRYQLHLGPQLFKQMLLTYKDSLPRKRPDGYQ